MQYFLKLFLKTSKVHIMGRQPHTPPGDGSPGAASYGTPSHTLQGVMDSLTWYRPGIVLLAQYRAAIKGQGMNPRAKE
jgi:hypothetical protein